MNHRLRTVMLLVVAIGGGHLAGCASQAPVPEDSFFRLHARPRGSEASAAILPGTLAVQRLQADGLTKGRAMLYSDAGQPLQIRQYHYHHWIDPPPRLLQEQLVSYLREASAAARVTATPTGSRPDYLLKGKIRRFEERRDADSRIVFVDLELELIRQRDTQTLLLEDYSITQTATGDTAHAVVEAYGLALEEIGNALLVDLRRVVSP